MILTLSVHPSRLSDLLTPDRVRLDPPIPANTYHDGFGNLCHVICAPVGKLTLSADFLIERRLPTVVRNLVARTNLHRKLFGRASGTVLDDC